MNHKRIIGQIVGEGRAARPADSRSLCSLLHRKLVVVIPTTCGTSRVGGGVEMMDPPFPPCRQLYTTSPGWTCFVKQIFVLLIIQSSVFSVRGCVRVEDVPLL